MFLWDIMEVSDVGVSWDLRFWVSGYIINTSLVNWSTGVPLKGSLNFL